MLKDTINCKIASTRAGGCKRGGRKVLTKGTGFGMIVKRSRERAKMSGSKAGQGPKKESAADLEN